MEWFVPWANDTMFMTEGKFMTSYGLAETVATSPVVFVAVVNLWLNPYATPEALLTHRR